MPIRTGFLRGKRTRTTQEQCITKAMRSFVREMAQKEEKHDHVRQEMRLQEYRCLQTEQQGMMRCSLDSVEGILTNLQDVKQEQTSVICERLRLMKSSSAYMSRSLLRPLLMPPPSAPPPCPEAVSTSIHPLPAGHPTAGHSH